MIKYDHLCLNHNNPVCRSILSSKLYCIKSDNWYKDRRHLNGKLKMKFQQGFQSGNKIQSLVELCAIRDRLSTCNAISYSDACELININS